MSSFSVINFFVRKFFFMVLNFFWFKLVNWSKILLKIIIFLKLCLNIVRNIFINVFGWWNIIFCSLGLFVYYIIFLVVWRYFSIIFRFLFVDFFNEIIFCFNLFIIFLKIRRVFVKDKIFFGYLDIFCRYFY